MGVVGARRLEPGSLESARGEPVHGVASWVKVWGSYRRFGAQNELLMARDHRPWIAVHTLTPLLQPTKGSAPLRTSAGVAGLGVPPADGSVVPNARVSSAVRRLPDSSRKRCPARPPQRLSELQLFHVLVSLWGHRVSLVPSRELGSDLCVLSSWNRDPRKLGDSLSSGWKCKVQARAASHPKSPRHLGAEPALESSFPAPGPRSFPLSEAPAPLSLGPE